MNTLIIIAKNTFRESIRNKILYTVPFFALLFFIVAGIFSSVSIGDHVLVLKHFSLSLLSIGGAVLVATIGISLLNKEISKKTILNILSKPIPRTSFLLGKFLGLYLTVAVLCLLTTIIFILTISIIQGSFDFILIKGLVFTLLEMTFLSALVIFFSVICKTTILSGLFTISFYLAGKSLPLLTYYIDNPETSSTVRTLLTITYNILPDLRIYTVSDALLYTNSISIDYLIMTFGYTVGYSTLLLIIAGIIFTKREFI